MTEICIFFKSNIFDNVFSGSLIIEENMTGDLYLTMVEETVYHLKNIEVKTQIDLVLLVDLLHFDCDWIGEEWPLKSPDLNQFDFFFGTSENPLFIKHNVMNCSSTPPNSR